MEKGKDELSLTPFNGSIKNDTPPFFFLAPLSCFSSIISIACQC